MTSSSSKITTSSLDSAWTPPTSASEVSPREVNLMVDGLSPDQPICFRICGIPSVCNGGDLEEALHKIYPELNVQNSKISTLFPACHESWQTALLTVYRRLEKYILRGLDKEIHHNYSFRTTRCGRDALLRFDKHFHDLTPMNIPKGPISVDLIAITGLSGHAFGSWRSRASIVGCPLDRPMWLRDFLPERFPHIRIMTYGYDSSLSQPNGFNFLDYARSFEQSIMNVRQDCPQRPIIFIAHSLGGLLVNQLLLRWSQRQEPNPLFDCVHGIFFFGTPHGGLRTKELSEMVNRAIWDRKTQILVAQLEEDGEFLENQKDNLSKMWAIFKGKVFTFYETEKSKVVREAAPGVWDRSGDLFQMVQRSSAQLFLPNEKRFPVQSNHTDMVKFNSPDDKTFRDVVSCMRSCYVPYDRTTVIESLVNTVLPGQTIFSFNPLKHLGIQDYKPHDLEETAGFTFMLHNLDYRSWVSKTGGIHTLVYKSFPCLPYALPYLIRTIQDTEETSLFLHFSLSGVLDLEQAWGGGNAMAPLVVWVFFRQVVETFPQDQGSCLSQVFLNTLLTSLRDDELVEIQADHGRAFDTIIKFAVSDTIWNALGAVLIKAANLFTTHSSPNRETSDLSLMLILDSGRGKNEWEAIIRDLNLLVRCIRCEFTTVKLLITDPPDTATIQLLPPSEILISYDEERQECLKTLYFKNLRYDKISVHHSHTLAWLWQSDEYKSWISLKYPDSGLLFIEGKPGSGKSTLVRYFADKFTPPSGAIVLKFFYNTRDGESERDHRNLLKTLLYQILKAEESFFIHFQSIYRREGESRIEWRSEDMKSILLACKTHLRPRTMYLIIDAMDESACTDRVDIVKFLHELSAPALNKDGCMVNIFLASRPINELQSRNWPGRQAILLQDMNREDIRRYTHCFLQKQNFDSVNPEVKKEIEDYIIAFSDGVFIWVHLVLKEIVEEVMNDSRRSTLMSFLESLPRSLESLYECMLQRLARNKGRTRIDGKIILEFCLFSGRAMALVDLKHALAITGLAESKEQDYKLWMSEISGDIRKTLTTCVGGFVDVKADTKVFPAVQIMHQTVREFFLNPGNLVQRSHLNVTAYNASEMIQSTCVRFLEIVCEEQIGFTIQRSLSMPAVQMCKHVQYLETRPFIKLSLEYLKENLDSLTPDVATRLSSLLERVEGSPRTLMAVLLSKIQSHNCRFWPDHNFGHDFQECIDRLTLHAAKTGHTTAIRTLLAISVKGVSNIRNARQQTLLHLAARGGHHTATMFLIDSGASLSAKDTEQRTALHHAVLEDHQAIIPVLLASGVDIHAWDVTGQNALHLAAINGLQASLQALLYIDNGYIHAENIEGYDALRLAVIHGQEDVFQLLLDGNANIGALGLAGNNALHLAARYGRKPFVHLLLAQNAEIDARNCTGQTALHLALLYDHATIVRIFLTRGCKFIQDFNGHTALHFAVRCHHEVFVRLLLTHNANPNTQDLSGRTALHLAVEERHGAVDERIGQNASGQTAFRLAIEEHREAIVEHLLTHNANPDVQDDSGQTTLHLAVEGRHEAIVENLLVHNANPDTQNASGQAALHLAAKYGQEAIAQFLLNHNVDTQVHDKDGHTALHLAIIHQQETMVRLLLTYNANPDAQNASGQTALHLAVEYRQNEIVQLLSDHNTNTQARGANGPNLAALNTPTCNKMDTYSLPKLDP